MKPQKEGFNLPFQFQFETSTIAPIFAITRLKFFEVTKFNYMSLKIVPISLKPVWLLRNQRKIREIEFWGFRFSTVQLQMAQFRENQITQNSDSSSFPTFSQQPN